MTTLHNCKAPLRGAALAPPKARCLAGRGKPLLLFSNRQLSPGAISSPQLPVEEAIAHCCPAPSRLHKVVFRKPFRACEISIPGQSVLSIHFSPESMFTSRRNPYSNHSGTIIHMPGIRAKTRRTESEGRPSLSICRLVFPKIARPQASGAGVVCCLFNSGQEESRAKLPNRPLSGRDPGARNSLHGAGHRRSKRQTLLAKHSESGNSYHSCPKQDGCGDSPMIFDFLCITNA
jgi:hypothetical protein